MANFFPVLFEPFLEGDCGFIATKNSTGFALCLILCRFEDRPAALKHLKP